MFKNSYPGNYEIVLTSSAKNSIEWKLVFEDELEELMFILKHRQLTINRIYAILLDGDIMRVYLNKPKDHWLSPYTILEKVFFWREIEFDEPIIERWKNRLEPFCQGLAKVLNVIHPKIDYVKIDYWDTWSMDHTLSRMILPMLKQLKDTKHGSPMVDDADAPEELRSTSAPPKENEWDTDDFIHVRWDWVLNEMIFAFTCLVDDSWEDAFCSGEFDHLSVPCEWDENGKVTMYRWDHGPNHTFKCDYDGMKVVQDRIQNGLRLFGVYYQALWD